jgi:hypothetical protein
MSLVSYCGKHGERRSTVIMRILLVTLRFRNVNTGEIPSEVKISKVEISSHIAYELAIADQLSPTGGGIWLVTLRLRAFATQNQSRQDSLKGQNF